MSFRDYEILDLDPSANLDEVKLSYRQLSLLNHPDQCGGDSTMYFRIKAAYNSILKEKSGWEDRHLTCQRTHLPSSENDSKSHKTTLEDENEEHEHEDGENTYSDCSPESDLLTDFNLKTFNKMWEQQNTSKRSDMTPSGPSLAQQCTLSLPEGHVSHSDKRSGSPCLVGRESGPDACHKAQQAKLVPLRQSQASAALRQEGDFVQSLATGQPLRLSLDRTKPEPNHLLGESLDAKEFNHLFNAQFEHLKDSSEKPSDLPGMVDPTPLISGFSSQGATLKSVHSDGNGSENSHKKQNTLWSGGIQSGTYGTLLDKESGPSVGQVNMLSKEQNFESLETSIAKIREQRKADLLQTVRKLKPIKK